MHRNRSRKLTVEECFALEVKELTRKGIFEIEGIHELVLTDFSAETSTKIPFEVERLGKDTERLFFLGSWVRNTAFEGGNDARYGIEVVSESCRFGGKRRYLRCPLLRRADICGRRVAKLFLPPGGCYFGCRTCYDLTYKSVQGHDKRVDELARLAIEDLDAALRSLPSRYALLGLKAIQKKRERLLRSCKPLQHLILGDFI
jgi:hypothetical protein